MASKEEAGKEVKEASEMKMLRRVCGVIKMVKIRNKLLRGTTKVVKISKKIQERRLL